MKWLFRNWAALTFLVLYGGGVTVSVAAGESVRKWAGQQARGEWSDMSKV